MSSVSHSFNKTCDTFKLSTNIFIQAIIKVKRVDQGILARSTSLEELPSCISEENKPRVYIEEERPRSGNDPISNLSSWGLSKSFNDSSVVRHSHTARI